MKFVRKRDGKLEDYDKNRICEAIWKAAQAVGNTSKDFAYSVGNQVDEILVEKFGDDGVPVVEEIQDLVERTLIKRNLSRMAKAYILYRHQHQEMRDLAISLNGIDLMDNYLSKTDWRINENANRNFSLQGLNNYVSTETTKNYWLNKIYSPEIKEAHVNGDVHIHTLNMLSVYCVGWDLFDLLNVGFKGVAGKLTSNPPKHFRTALGQLVNFLFTLQQESAGAQAVSDIDVLLAPFISKDKLDYNEIKQCLQEFVFNMNVATRTGGETPFSNITLALKVPEYFRDMPVTINGEFKGDTYSSFQDEADLFNKALFEVYLEGDASNRVHTFPIPTYNITKDFDWNNQALDGLWKIAAKYGIPYFANFINSDMDVSDSRSMCCHLRLQLDKLLYRGGGYFGASSLTGSIGVCTINMAKIGYNCKDEKEYFERLEKLMIICKDALETKRKILERFTSSGLYPYTKFYLRDVEKRFNEYWKNHFSTIGLLGMNESLMNFMNVNVGTKEGIKFTLKVLDFMRNEIVEFQKDTSNLYNLEATPAEGSSYRLALLDQRNLKDSHFANGRGKEPKDPFYTNSTQLPVNYTDDVFNALELQDEIQSKYTGGTAFHAFLGEQIHEFSAAKVFVKKIFESFKLPYLTLTPTFSICTDHGYFNGKVERCPKCNKEMEIYSRVVGYLRPENQWHRGKRAEFQLRKTFKV